MQGRDPPTHSGGAGRNQTGRAESTPAVWLIQGVLMQPAVNDGTEGAAGRALERALNLAEAEGVLIPFLVRRAPRPSARLSEGETRVLWYLPTELSVPDIAEELGLSVNTVKTHMRHLYAKLGAHRRRDAVREARANGLLPPPLEGERLSR